MGEKRKTAIYLRISTEDAQPESTCAGEGESLSISHQRSYLLEYIRKDKRLAGSEVMEFCDDADIIGLNQKTFDLRGFTD